MNILHYILTLRLEPMTIIIQLKSNKKRIFNSVQNEPIMFLKKYFIIY